MKPISTIICLVLLFSFTSLLGQSPGQKAVAVFKEGEQALLNKKYEKAVRLFEKALGYQPDLTAAKRNIGTCYELLNEYDKAIEQYERVLRADSLFSKPLYYQLGEAYYKMGFYDKAMDKFRKYKIYVDNDSLRFSLDTRLEKKLQSEFTQKIEGTLQACRVAMDSIQFVNITEVVNLGPAINSNADEYFPYVSNDQEMIFFNRRKGTGEDENLFFSKMKKEKWEKSSPVSSFNTNKDEGMCTLVRDGRRVFFTACRRDGVKGTCDIWQALVDDTEIHSMESLGGFINSDRWESQAAVSCDGTELYFASNREGGLGGTDLWYSKRQDDGSWSMPKNLGSAINTNGDEEAPFITNDGKTLYFSSTGHLGMGEQDIFMSWWDDIDDTWSVPINLGPPVNSAYRELGLFLSADGQTGYFSSMKPGGYGGMDIYKFKLSQQLYSEPITYVEGFVRDSVIDIAVQTKVNINGKGVFPTDKDGRFFLCVGADETLDMRVKAKSYKPYHNQFIIPEWNNRTFYTIELLMQPTISFLTEQPVAEAAEEQPNLTPKTGKVQVEYAHSIYFDFNASEFDMDEFERLEDFIKRVEGKEIKRVEIIGFADDVGEDAYNLKLSEERAKKIALTLIDNKIVVDQIYLEGKGEVKNSIPKEKNRRVDIKVFALE